MNADEFMDEPINDDVNPLIAPAASVENHDAFVDDDNKDNESVGQVEDEQQQPQHSEVPVKDNHEAYFTKSTVKDPVKESDGQNAYISYLVETEVGINKGEQPFRDFIILTANRRTIQFSRVVNSWSDVASLTSTSSSKYC